MKSPYEGDFAYPAVLCYHDKQKREIALHKEDHGTIC